MKALKCKPSAQFAYSYSINDLSKCSNIISHNLRGSTHRSSKVDTSIFLRRSTHRSSKVNTSISEGRHIDLRKSTHRSSKVNTSISEGRHIHLQKSTHRSSKVDTSTIDLTSIFEDRRQKHRTDNPTSHRQFVTEYCPQRRSIVLYLNSLHALLIITQVP